MHNEKASLARASFWTSIAGVIVPACLTLLLAIWVLLFVPQGRLGPSYEDQLAILVALAICGILFFLLELFALGSGIAARHTVSGKIGLVISGVLLALALGVTAFILYRSDFFKFW